MRTSLLGLIALSLLTSPLLAQANYAPVATQQPAWVSSPDSTAITGYFTAGDGQEGPTPNKPFSGIEVRHSQQRLADGTHIDHEDTSEFYRDTQGRMRVDGADVIVIFDPILNRTFTLHLQEKNYEQTLGVYGVSKKTKIVTFGNDGYISATKEGQVPQDIRHFSWGEEFPYNFQPSSHVDTIQLGTKSLNGILCKGIRVTLTIPAHAEHNDRDIHVVNEHWYSDDLMVLVKSSNDDPRFGTSSYELKDINRKEPDPSLFKLPDGFTKSSKSWF